MKTLKQAWLAVVMLMLLGRTFALAQETGDSFSNLDLSALSDNGVLQLSGTNIPSFTTFSDDQLNALVDVLDATPAITATNLPFGGVGTYWSLAQPNYPPLPGDTIGVNAWPMSDGSFLLDDLNFDYGALQGAGPMMGTMDYSSPPLPGGGEDGTNYYTPNGTSYSFNPGTNLWIALTNVASAYISGFVSNTAGNMQIEIQFTTDLAFQPWQSAGWYVYGSQLTNWTAWVEPTISSSNLFLRAVAYTDDGSGLPISWQLEYFGTTGVNPNGDPMGDGWSNIQKFNDGMNPNEFYMPPAPVGFTATYDQNNGAVDLSWLPAPGNVTGYVLVKYDGQEDDITTNYISSSAVSYADSIAGETTVDWPVLYVEYSLEAIYGTNGATSPTWAYVEDANAPNATAVTGSQGLLTLVIPNLPSDLSYLEVYRQQFLGYTVDYFTVGIWYGSEDPFFGLEEPISEADCEIPASSITNGVCQIPGTLVPPLYENTVWVQTVRSNGIASGWDELGGEFETPQANIPFVDARQQLKDNLRFLLRAAGESSPFAFIVNEGGEDWGIPPVFAWPLNNYVYAGFYGDGGNYGEGDFDELQPIAANCFYHNFVFDQNNLDTNGLVNTSCSGGYSYEISGGLTLPCLEISNYPAYYFDFAGYLTNSIPIPSSQITSGDAEWLLPSDGGVLAINGGTIRTSNLYGLTNLSVQCAYINTNGQPVLQEYFPGQTLPTGVDGVEYFQTAEPVFTNLSYYFARVGQDVLPEQTNFVTTNVTPAMFQGVGSSQQIAGYEKLGILNAYSDFFAYLGQYFTNAYEVDTNGNVTADTTGILSPYGDFFATDSGPVALVTIPDIDTGAQGTCTVYCVSLNVDENHDGEMDLTFNGADSTSATSPDQIWVNDNYDRWHEVDCTLTSCDSEQDDLGPDEISNLPAYQQVPDFEFATSTGEPAIPCNRDLEDYFRLWMPGLAAAMRAMPAGYSVQLTLTGTGGIRIFQAVEPDGGTNYLFDETTASNQVNNAASLYLGILTSASPITLDVSTNFTEHFIFCGTTNGKAQIDLQILDQNTNVVADAPLYLQINEIKQMYERWTVGDNSNATNMAPLLAPILATDRLQTNPPVEPFQYSASSNTNTPYILYVHGWNMESWEKDRFAETAYKRLYWQGYQGRFGLFRWPTGFGFSGLMSVAIDARNYDTSESNSWASAVGLTNMLTQLNTEYPGHVYVMAHSMGNIVTGEALRLANRQLVNTYVGMQGAVPAHAYDPSTATNSTHSEPDDYASYWTNDAPSYFDATAGAGHYINFYNTNDYALSKWLVDQSFKPDMGLTYPGYHYSSSSGYYKLLGSTITVHLTFPTNTYEIFAFDDPAWSYALGAQSDVDGAFNLKELDLQTVWPPDTHPQPDGLYSSHVWHSAEFRDDFAHQAGFWKSILSDLGFNLK